METVKVKLEPGINKSEPTYLKSGSSLPLTSSPNKTKENGSRNAPSSSISHIPRLKPIDKSEIKVKLEKPVTSSCIKNADNKGTVEKKKMMNFIIDVPELEFKEDNVNDNESDCSKFSSPFDSRVDTAGTNITFITKSTHQEEKRGLKKLDIRTGLGNHVIEDFSDLTEKGSSFGSSPCVDQNLKLKRKQELNKQKQHIQTKRKKIKGFDKVNQENKENFSFNSIEATDGDSETRSQEYGTFDEQRPCTPPQYRINEKPIYEYMEGEDAIYFDIMGKKDVTEKLDNNEKQFFDFVHLNFNQWVKQSELFNHEYKKLMEKVVVARIKFDKRFQYLRKNLDDFALNLEKFGTDINKRSEILKEYCNKIVNEIE